MSLRLPCLIVARLCGWLVLLCRPPASKDAGLPALRHEAAVLRRTNPRLRLDWAGRAILATLIRLRPARLRAHRLITPGTVLRWHRRLVTRTRAWPDRARRPPASAGTATRREQPAAENRGGGYQRIPGELLTLGHRGGASTIRRVRTAPTIPPAPERHAGAAWRQLWHTQASTMLAAGLFPTDRAVTLQRLYCLLIMEAGTRCVPLPRGHCDLRRAVSSAADPQPSTGSG